MKFGILSVNKRDLDFGLFREFLDHFHYHGGFDYKILQLSNTNEQTIERNESTQNNSGNKEIKGTKLPFELVPFFTSPFKNVGCIVDQKY